MAGGLGWAEVRGTIGGFHRFVAGASERSEVCGTPGGFRKSVCHSEIRPEAVVEKSNTTSVQSGIGGCI